MASLATFIVGIQAVRLLSPESLGAYGLVFGGFALLMEFSARLVFLPAEIEAARRPAGERLGILGPSLRAGWPSVLLSGLLLVGVAWLIPDEVAPAVVVGLLATAIPCTMISPVQDHLRKMLHTGDRSFVAAAVSGIQLAAVIATLAVLTVADIPAPWHPFGALFVANVVSSAVGAVAWWRGRPAVVADPPKFSTLAGAGRWHLLAGAAPKVGGLAAASVVAHIAGVPALGYAEGARVLARPVAVLSQGIKATIGPPLMRAAATRDRAASRRLSRLYAVIVGGCGVAYLLVAGFDWALNPLPGILPNAYAVPGLAAAMIAVFTVDRVAGSGAGMQLFGAGRARSFAVVETVSSAGQAAASFTALFAGAFAVPLGYLAASLIRRPWVALLVRGLYRDGAAPGGSDGVERIDPELSRAEAPTVEPAARE